MAYNLVYCSGLPLDFLCRHIVYKGIRKEMQPSVETNTKLSDVKGVDEAKAELEEIVDYLKDPKVLKGDNVDLMTIARFTPGFSGADLANLVNIAALRAAKDGAKAASTHDLEFAREKIEGKSVVTSEELRKKIAYHESGHALVTIYTDGAYPVREATIDPRGVSLGRVSYLPPDKQSDQSFP